MDRPYQTRQIKSSEPFARGRSARCAAAAVYSVANDGATSSATCFFELREARTLRRKNGHECSRSSSSPKRQQQQARHSRKPCAVAPRHRSLASCVTPSTAGCNSVEKRGVSGRNATSRCNAAALQNDRPAVALLRLLARAKGAVTPINIGARSAAASGQDRAETMARTLTLEILSGKLAR